jgi:two-component system cell cycle sensor histidine kinase/response regulator CckA
MREKLDSMARLCARLAHKINNQIAILRHSVDFLSMELETKVGKGHEFKDLIRIKKVCTGLEVITAKLIEFTGNTKVFDPRKLALNRAVNTCFYEIRKNCPAGISFRVNLSPKNPMVIADPEHLQIIISNILHNSVEAIQENGEVSIETTEEGELKISDTGVGIETQNQDLVFEPFFTTKPDKSFGGFGLSTAFGFTTMNGGSIGFRSKWGKGTEISVKFRMAQVPDHISGHIPGMIGSNPEANPIIVLVVNDNEEALKAIEKALPPDEYIFYGIVNESSLTDTLDVFKVVPQVFVMSSGKLGEKAIDRMNQMLAQGNPVSAILLGDPNQFPAIEPTEQGQKCIFLAVPFSNKSLLDGIKKVTEEYKDVQNSGH